MSCVGGRGGEGRGWSVAKDGDDGGRGGVRGAGADADGDGCSADAGVATAQCLQLGVQTEEFITQWRMLRGPSGAGRELQQI